MKRKIVRNITKRISINLTMKFEQVYDSHATNQDIFLFSMRPLISSIMVKIVQRLCTGASKTFTMLGNDGHAHTAMNEKLIQIQIHYLLIVYFKI